MEYENRLVTDKTRLHPDSMYRDISKYRGKVLKFHQCPSIDGCMIDSEKGWHWLKHTLGDPEYQMSMDLGV